MNILAIIVLVLFLWKIADGYKKGMVKEIISFISLLVLCLVAALIRMGLSSYMEGEFVGVAVAVVLLALLSIAHHLVGAALFPAKILSKLPIIHWADKLLGMVVGALEVVMILWTVYLFIMHSAMGVVGQQILSYVQGNSVLYWLYRYNLLAGWVEQLGGSLGII